MAVDLIYKHQQKTYELMNKALEEKGRAAYIYPTGCGKSFPALKYIEDNPEKKATIVVPSNFIKKQYKKNIKKYVENGKERLKDGSIKIVTYQERHFKNKAKEKRTKTKLKQLLNKRKNILSQKFASFSKFFIPKIDSDIVVFDEIHRMGATEWEKAVNRMLLDNPKRKIIGMSATPERTDKRNMAYEKFGDSVVYEMSLTEALSGEKEGEVLLKAPNYVRVISTLKAELPKYKEQIDLLEDGARKERCIKVYQKLDTLVSNFPDIQDIMAAGIKKINGKYIVFCKDRDDMFDKIEHANEIFGKVNSKINIDYVITKRDRTDTEGKTKIENERTLEEFEARENGDGLNLLFCVDMLNEGVHLEGIDGEILFDLTKSPILYKQRIGRVLSSDKEAGDAVIIDAANNWINQIQVYREIEEAIYSGKAREQNEGIDYESLKLLPEELELLDILKEIGEIFKYNQTIFLKNAKLIQEWCKTNYGDKPIEERRLPTADAIDEEERTRGNQLHSIKRFITTLYDKVETENIENEEHREIARIVRSLQKEYGLSKSLKNAIRIQKWCEKHFENKEIEDRRLPTGESKDEEERKLGKQLNNIKSTILKQYEGKDLEEIENLEHREIVRIMRKLQKEYGLSDSLKNALKVQKWCEKKYGDKPREERKLPSSTSKDDEEKDLGDRLVKLRYFILKQYEGIELEKIDNEEHREVVKIVRNLDKEYGLSDLLKNAIKIQKWCEKRYGDKPREERCLPSKRIGCNKEEYVLATKLTNLRQKVQKKYLGKPLEEIEDLEHREIVSILRNLDKEYGLSDSLKNAIKIQKWCERNYGDKPKEERCLPSDGELSSDEERKLSYAYFRLRTILAKNAKIKGIDDEEYEEIRKIMTYLQTEYGLSDSLKNVIIIQKWCIENFGNKPREERRMPSLGAIGDDKERSVAKKLNVIDQKIMKLYDGVPLDDIKDEEHRKIVEIIRELYDNYMTEEQRKRRENIITKRMKNSVAKHVEHNADTRRELEVKIKEYTDLEDTEAEFSDK